MVIEKNEGEQQPVQVASELNDRLGVGRIDEFRGRKVTVYRNGDRETMVYGDGADWMVQRTDVTNHVKPWRVWFSHRVDAEKRAREMVEA